MKKIAFVICVIGVVALSCSSEDDCRRCTGTVSNTGANADWTVCDNDGSVIRTNNLTEDSETSTSTLPEAVAFFESIGLECE